MAPRDVFHPEATRIAAHSIGADSARCWVTRDAMMGASCNKMLCSAARGLRMRWLFAPSRGTRRARLAAESSASGAMTLERCAGGARLLRPTSIVRSIPPARSPAASRSISSSIRTRPAGPSAGTLVATEGGPGYPATVSREDYLALFGPAARDARCRADGQSRHRQIGRRRLSLSCRPRTNGPWSWSEPAAPRSASARRSTARPMPPTIWPPSSRRSGPGRIDLYGDSYGTYFEQVFALRHPDALRSVVLDGAYPLNGPDYAWYPTYAPAMRDKFNIACRRSRACARLPGSSHRRTCCPCSRSCARSPSPRAPPTATARSAIHSRCLAARHRHVRQRARPRRPSRSSTPRRARSSAAIARRCCGSWPRP